MFVTKHNMASAVATVSKQLEHVSEAVVVSRVYCANISFPVEILWFMLFAALNSVLCQFL